MAGEGDLDDVTVIVPAFNEATSIGAVVAELRTVFPHVVVVDDGSTDATADLARTAGASVVQHPINLGAGAAVQTGFDYVRHQTSSRICVTFDADGQHLTSDAVHLVDALRSSNADVALGTRFVAATSQIPTVRRLVLRAGGVFTRITTQARVSDPHNGLRAFRTDALSAISLRQSGMAHASELHNQIAAARLRFVEVPTTVLYTDYSRSKGQPSMNAVNIVFDLALAKLRA